MAYTSTKLSKGLLPTLKDISDAVKKATSGALKDRDPREMMAYIERLLVADPRLDGHINTRTAAVATFPWEIRPASEDLAEQADQVKTLCAEAIDELTLRHMDADHFGVALARVDWKMDDGGTGLWMPDVGKFFGATEIDRVDGDSQFPDGVAILAESGTSFARIAPVNTNESTYVPQVVGREIGGRGRKVLYHEALLNMNLQDWSNFNRKLKGLAVATYREGADPQDQATAMAALQALGVANAAVTSDAIGYEFVKMVDAIGKDSYRDFKEALVTDIAIAYLGQANTAELPDSGGSRAALQVLNLIRTDILLMDLLRVQRMINKFLLRPYFEHNVQKLVPAKLPWRFEFIQEEREDVEANARIIETLQRATVPLLLEDVYAKTGFRQPKEGDVTLGSAVPGVPSSGGLP